MNEGSTPHPQQQITLEELNQLIWNHLEARDWHRNPARGLAISLALEANELLEHYQWGDTPVGGPDGVGDELADVFIYGMQIAQRNNIDIAKHIERKLEKSNQKYPAGDFKGKTGDEIREAWKKNKLAYKKEGL
jgi:NTP pyrophosphatase (non-canonical NTP hydrolase)